MIAAIYSRKSTEQNVVDQQKSVTQSEKKTLGPLPPRLRAVLIEALAAAVIAELEDEDRLTRERTGRA